MAPKPKPGSFRAAEQGVFPGMPQAQPSQPRQRPQRNPDAAPAGYVQGYWDLARYFVQLAEQHGQAVKGVPVAYLAIKARAEQQHLETGEDAIEWDRHRPVPDEYKVTETYTEETRRGTRERTRTRLKPRPKDWNATKRMRDLYIDGEGRPVDWQGVGRAIIERFWSDPKVQEARSGADPLADFTRLDIFEHCYGKVCHHWESLRIKATIARQVARKQASPDYEPRDIIRRKPDDQ
jgi:hypothetical protein